MSLAPVSPTRRTVLRTAAWSVPVVTVATAAPAFATSNLAECTVTHTVDWGALNSDGTNVYPVPPRVPSGATTARWSVPAQPFVTGGTWDASASLVPVELNIATTMLAGTLTASGSSFNGVGTGHFDYTDLNQTSNADDADLRVGRALKFGTSKGNAGSSDMRITLSFSKAVKNVAFTITDIDSNGSNQEDHVWIESINDGTPAFVAQYTTVTSGGQARSFTGSGLNTSENARWRGNAGADNNSVRGNVRVTAAGPESGIHSLQLRFGNYSTNTGNRNNTINIGKVEFQTMENICVKP